MEINMINTLLNNISYGFFSALFDKLHITDINVFLINLTFAIILIGFGIFLGKFVRYLLKRIIEKSNVQRGDQKKFVDLFLIVIKWAIYLLFLSLALNQLGIPELTDWLTSKLVIIPAIVGAWILIIIGFVVATYIRDLIREIRVQDSIVLANIFYYFILYTFLLFSLKAIFISQDEHISNIVLVIFTIFFGIYVTYFNLKNK